MFCGLFLISCTKYSEKKEKPNIVLIMCDDMGFSDLSCYGGEINTPNIDGLAKQGVRFNNFKNTSRCCPSRASLLTGRYQHSVGMGWMTVVDEHRDGYRGQITKNVPTIAEVFKENGYSTYMSGKWHVTVDGNLKTGELKSNGSWPIERGFEKYYGGLTGGGNYYKPNQLINNKTEVTKFPDDYYYTSAITDSAVSYIESHDTNKPMFMYVAHYAPHRPLQAPKERIDKCRERYKRGYDILRQERFDQLKELGLINSNKSLPIHTKEYHKNRPSWESLNDDMKEKWITEMSTYAAMIEIMDDGIGKVIEATKRKKIYDNTVFIFLSDNGATSEGGLISQLAADLSNTPFRYYKQWTYMGGISSPLIIHYPKSFSSFNGSIRTENAHIIDILPTCLDLANLSYPKSFKDNSISGLDGISLLPAIKDEQLIKRDLFFEHQSSCAVISGNWKLVKANKNQAWELIDLNDDPFEENDLSSKFPEKVKELEIKWNDWAKKNNVFYLESKPWGKRIQYYKEQNSDQDGIE